MDSPEHCDLTRRLDKLETKVDKILELIAPLKVKIYTVAAIVSVLTAFIVAHIASR